jgi:hypothetical protein
VALEMRLPNAEEHIFVCVALTRIRSGLCSGFSWQSGTLCGPCWPGSARLNRLWTFIFRLHMITPPYKIAAFNLGTAATLVLVTAGIGYVMGWVVGFIWTRFGSRTA